MKYARIVCNDTVTVYDLDKATQCELDFNVLRKIANGNVMIERFKVDFDKLIEDESLTREEKFHMIFQYEMAQELING